ncbi:lysophospholipid acyltransferase family protein [Roseofilum capinflatum]|uniref:1-acyl-sn-glycerol-3-phosphate acyltransferase n=1 Tax=Roseofilum capinflatum BLCC-M114 TaxID=3022440 RepID=A0ABT7B9C5_9CYAN|nr:1-acyl-sn-glycerol-3-phosphate acyltransferase [Roseofilum capinflatum]MDJ1175417.1 1-acyl-sn-glycerol-3-phosphate acyltransferase [Roseofilum capinflatum BLCC-M114]
MLAQLSKWELRLPLQGQEKAIATPPTASSISPWLTPLVYPFARHLVLPSYFRSIEVQGPEHFPTDGSPVILAPTHRSRWDCLMVPYALGKDITGRHLRFMVSANEMRGIQGWFIRRLGGFAINPQQPAISSLRHGLELLGNREALVIFPEGNIYRDRQVHPLKPGLARLALQAQTHSPQTPIKILPISLNYDQAFPQQGCSVQINIGTPLEVSTYSSGHLKTDAQHLTSDLFQALSLLQH